MRILSGATLVVALVFASMSPPVQAGESYPSWADVEAARSSTAATQAAVTRIGALLAGLETKAAELGDAAIVASAAAVAAGSASDLASARAAVLTAQLTGASEKATAANVQLGLLGAQLYRAGSSGLVARMLLTADRGADLLYQLGVSTRLSETTAGIQARALAQRNLVQSLEKQAAVAARERDRLAGEATDRAAAAAVAQRAAEAQLAVQNAASDVLIAQLASLKNSTAETERSYLAGVAAAEAYKRQQAEAALAAERAARQAAAAQGAASGGPVGTAPPSGIVVDPAAARNYAASAVSARGWDGSQFACLVSLWNRESSWRADAFNAGSGAYGIPQSLPGSKMASAGGDWRTNAATQINWGLGYIAARYGTPCGAWAQSERVNWY